MTVLFKTLDKTIDLEAHPDYEGIKNRFYDDFEVFVRNKKIEAVIEALKGTGLLGSSPANNFVKVLNYLADDFENKVINDPSNQSNEVSDELTIDEKQKIKNLATATLAGAWNQAIW